MRIPKQVPPIQRRPIRRRQAHEIMPRKNIYVSEISILPLSEIANNPSILFDEGVETLGKNPLIHFDIEKPIPPVEMCDAYCNSQMCDVYCIDAKERIIHGHIYNDIKRQISQDNLSINTKEKIIHGHIYGDVDRQSP